LNMSVAMLTGFPGFIGTRLVKKLALSRSEIDKFYLLVQSKYRSLAEKKVKEIEQEVPNSSGKFELVEGDITLPGLGIKGDERLKERMGDYKGKTVQVVPHIIDEIIERITKVNKNKRYEVVIVELGGTIGDIESQPFTEAIREMKLKLKKNQVLIVHLVLIPYIKTAGELKTKPAQHSVQRMNELGLQPDILLCRIEKPLPENIKEKLSLFCNVEKRAVINAVDVDNIYEIPLNFKKEGLDKIICEKLELKPRKNSFEWEKMVKKMRKIKKKIKVGIAGKYTELHDAYKSLIEALTHAGIANNVNVEIEWIQTDKSIDWKDYILKKEILGVIVPGGFGERGIREEIEKQKTNLDKINKDIILKDYYLKQKRFI
jgi:CTP synthase